MTWSWTGETVLLRELRDGDLLRLVDWLNSAAVGETQTSGPLHPKPALEAGKVFVNFSANGGSSVGLSIVELDGHELVGHLMLFGVEAKDRCGTVSVLVGPEHQRKGFAYDALQLLIRYAFLELGLHRLELTVNAFNTAGLGLYKKLGFVEEGRRRKAIYRGGAWHDHVLMGLLESEWHVD